MRAFDVLGPSRSFAHDPLLVALYEAPRVLGAPLNVGLHALVLRRWRRARKSAP
jgi:hypothetical protein